MEFSIGDGRSRCRGPSKHTIGRHFGANVRRTEPARGGAPLESRSDTPGKATDVDKSPSPGTPVIRSLHAQASTLVGR